MRKGSLCTGYGGLDLAVRCVLGGTLAWTADNAPDAATVIEERFAVPNLGDLRAVDWAEVEPVDVLTAGYPCQPFSQAGRREGEADARHLWPEIARAIGVLRPRLVVLENVPGHLSLGFGRVLGDLAEAGFDAEWCVLRASEVGAPHRRARVFVVATDTEVEGRDVRPGLPGGPHRGAGPTERGAAPTSQRDDADGRCWGAHAAAVERWEAVLGRAAPTPLNPDNPKQLNARFVEWMMGLPDGWVTDLIPNRRALAVLGNGVVPQQAAAALRILLAEHG